MKEFLGKAVLTMAAQGGLLHGGVHQTENNFFQRRAGRGSGWAETLLLQGVQGSAAQRGAVQKSGGVLGRADCSCEADEIMLTLETGLSERSGARAGWVGAPAEPWAFLRAAGRAREEGA